MNKESDLTKQFDRYVSVPHLHTGCPAFNRRSSDYFDN